MKPFASANKPSLCFSDRVYLCFRGFFFQTSFSRGRLKQFIMFTAPEPISDARGTDQIKTEITACSLCLEGTKTPFLILTECRMISLAYCIYYNCKEGKHLSQHASVLFNILFITWNSLTFTKHPCRFHFIS